jgi:SAM-dependent methyltransferase
MTPEERFQRPEILACPLCRADALDWPAEGPAGCHSCGASFPLHNGWPLFLRDGVPPPAAAEWDNVADRYTTYAPACGFPLIDNPLIDSCRGDVLEVGCGNGRLMQLVQDRCRTLVGIDPAPAMTTAARKTGFFALTAAAEELPFRDQSFDQVISGWASMRYTEQDRSFPEVARVLRPGGTFTFTLWNYQLSGLIWRFGYWRRGKLAPHQPHTVYRDRDVSNVKRMKQKLAAAGLQVLEIRSTPFPGILARILQPLTSYYRGSLGARLGYNVIFTCRRS